MGEVTVSMSSANPYFEDYRAAINRGDHAEADDIAMRHGKVIYRTAITTDTSADAVEVGVPFVASAEVKWGVQTEHTTAVYVKPEGYRESYQVPLG